MIRKRTYNTRRIKRSLSYSVQDISDLFAIHKNTIREWMRDGLPVNDNEKPYLIHGSALIEFLNKRQKGRKRACQPNQFFCFKCRCPREAWGNLADLTIKNEKSGYLSVLCCVCESRMNKVISRSRIPDLAKIFCIQTLDEKRLADCADPSVKTHKETL